MDYFKKKREKKLAEQLYQLKRQKGNPVVIDLKKTIFYPEEAFDAMRSYIHLAGIRFTIDDAAVISKRLKLAAGFGKDGNRYFWFLVSDKCYFAVEIGKNSKLFVGNIVYLPYGEVADDSVVDIFAKSCRWQLHQKADLYAKFLYKDNQFIPKALFLRGTDIPMRNIFALKCLGFTGIWDLDVECGNEADQADKGRTGEAYDVWVGAGPINCFSVAYSKEALEGHPGLWRHEKWWKGDKVIRRFSPDEQPQLESMLLIWDRYRKNI